MVFVDPIIAGLKLREVVGYVGVDVGAVGSCAGFVCVVVVGNGSC